MRFILRKNKLRKTCLMVSMWDSKMKMWIINKTGDRS